MSTIKMRSKESNGLVTVKALIKHPMETGARKNKKTGELIPPHFIQEVYSKRNSTPSPPKLPGGPRAGVPTPTRSPPRAPRLRTHAFQ